MKTLSQKTAFHSATEVVNFFRILNLRIRIAKSLLQPCGHTFYVASMTDGYEVVGSLDFIVSRFQRHISESYSISNDSRLEWSN
jgi:hypothetical protein